MARSLWPCRSKNLSWSTQGLANAISSNVLQPFDISVKTGKVKAAMFGDSTGKTSTKIIVLKQITNAFCLKLITFVNERRSWCSLKISRAVLIIRQPYQPEYVTLSSAGRDINQLEQIRSSPAMLSTPPYVSSKHTVTWAPEISRCSPAMTSLFTPQKELWDGLERKERGKKRTMAKTNWEIV